MTHGLHALKLHQLVRADRELMRALRRLRALGPADGWLAAGAVRDTVWRYLHHADDLHAAGPTKHADLDAIWFSTQRVHRSIDQRFEHQLNYRQQGGKWQVKNQVRMHRHQRDFPYQDLEVAMRHWPETATAIAVRLDWCGKLHILAPFGLDDLFGLKLRAPARCHTKLRAAFHRRLANKRWLMRFPRLTLQ